MAFLEELSSSSFLMAGNRRRLIYAYVEIQWLENNWIIISSHQQGYNAITSYLNVEIGEEAQKHDRVETHDVGDDDGEIALDEEQLGRVNEDGDELDHLDGGQVLLPPQVFLVFGSHGRQQVVGVHDHVDERVQNTEESGVASRCEFDPPPDGRRHDAVVNDVQIGDLIEFLAHDEEDGIQKFGELAEVVPPAQLDDDQLVRIVRIVDRLTTQTVPEQPSVNQSLQFRPFHSVNIVILFILQLNIIVSNNPIEFEIIINTL